MMTVGPHDTLGSAQIRAQHTALMVRLLWKERNISRADLARHTGLSRSTVSGIIGDLLDTKLVTETGAGESNGGRRPIMLRFEDDAYMIVGVDLGASHVSVALTNLRADVRAWHERPHDVRTDPKGTITLIGDLVERCIQSVGVSRRRILGMGVAVPSPVNPQKPGRLLPLILPEWADIDLVAALQEAHGIPVRVDNDANLGALAEHWWGAGVGVQQLAYVKVATGIGAGLLIDGRIFRGAAGAAGEIGHTSIDQSGPRCVCGLNGCLTTLVGSNAIVESARLRRTAQASALTRHRGLTVERIVDAALEGDEVAREVVRDAGSKLGIGVANLLNLLNPQMVVLGGGLMRAGNILLEPLRETLRARSLSEAIAHAEVVRSTLGERNTAIGAATLVLQAALEDLSMFPIPKLAQGGAR